MISSAPLRVLWLLTCLACERPTPLDLSGPVADWPDYGGTKAGLRWSPLDQITQANVEDLEVAWVHHHGDISDGSGELTRTSFNATPIVVNDSLYFCTGLNRVVALDPETGTERWSFDPEPVQGRLKGPYPRTCRGVAHWTDPRAEPGAACAERIFTGTVDAELIALDATTGRPCQDFGSQGRIALREGLEAEAWEYYVTSPPLTILDKVVVGALVADNVRADAPAGVVRAFDTRTGELRWAWDPVPPDWEPDPASYTAGTPNVWSILSGDPERDLVFVPTGNASPDYFGGARRGLDFFSSSTVALRASTGELVWRFQTVHHDVWDYDVASQPTLFDFVAPGQRPVPALAQATKMGHLFLLNRESGVPLFPVEERPVPQGGVAGETLAATQPFPTHPAPLHPAELTLEDAFGFTPFDRGACAERIEALRYEGIFTPASVGGSIQYPGSGGGANWGGVSIDPDNQRLFVNQMRMAQVVRLIPRAEYEALSSKQATYPEELYPMAGTPYAVQRGPLLSPLGVPCTPPPWGTLSAVDLVTGRVLWESTLGTTRDQAPFPFWFDLGTPNLGGSIATGGGLVFIGATTDRFLRAFDQDTGEEIWRARLPYTANATPITYRLSPQGRQYVVVAAGGHGWSEPGDALIAFALKGPLAAAPR
jgi:quinoprotein glucose dehydrogenase